jgi:glycine betaine/proline transport system ATP-binding protein
MNANSTVIPTPCAVKTKISVRNIYKVFGAHSQKALDLLLQGKDKSEVLQQTGCNVGLCDISLDIPEGKISVIMGLSGSGKSTLVRHFNRLIEPTSGEILIDGKNILTLNDDGLRQLRRDKISMVFQGFGLLPHWSVLDNASFALLTRGVGKSQAHERAYEWLSRVGLSCYANAYPDQLSGGMRQRVGLARALAADTDIILMDEAFSALDPLIRAEMQEQLLVLQKDYNKTIVFITHDLDEAVHIGSQIAILRDGVLVQVGDAEDIQHRPADDYVRRFVEKRSTGHSSARPS